MNIVGGGSELARPPEAMNSTYSSSSLLISSTKIVEVSSADEARERDGGIREPGDEDNELCPTEAVRSRDARREESVPCAEALEGVVGVSCTECDAPGGSA